MISYQLIDHTADIGIKVKGRDLKSLFVNAAKAMFDVMVERGKGVRAVGLKKMKIEVEGDSLEELFIRWLNELLSLSDWKDIIFTKFIISKFNSMALTAAAQGLPGKFFESRREIKAVTYHDLKIIKEKAGYSAQVIFDV